MGLTNAPAMFMRTMNSPFVEMLEKWVVVFLDDIVIYSTIVEEYFELLEKVLTCLCKQIFYCKLKKCSFLWKTTIFVGFNIAPESIHISYAKV